jgi:hypothetical protein
MKRQIIFTLVVSLLSFGMIDSAVTKDKSNSIETMLVDLEKERELELLKIEQERIRIEQYHKQELENFLKCYWTSRINK